MFSVQTLFLTLSQGTPMIRILILFLFILPLTNISLAQKGQKLIPPTSGIYAGVFPDMGNTEDSLTTERIQEYLNITGTQPLWICFSNSWFYGIKFPKDKAESVAGFNSIPYIRIMPRSDWGMGRPDLVYGLDKIANGDFDEDLIKWAKDAKKFGKPILVEFAPEMNGNWFPWSGVFNFEEEGAELYKDAHRHVVDLMRETGADNLTWMYHVNAVSEPNADWNRFISYYPGDEYIDWLGMSVYGSQKVGWPWAFFYPYFRSAYRELEKLSKVKPIAIAEFGVVEDPSAGNKAEWIRDAFETVLSGKFPRLKAISYWHSSFDNADGSISNMRIDSSPEALKVYKEFIDMEVFKVKATFK